MLGKKCITEDCSNSAMIGRRYCRDCYLKRKRMQAHEYYLKSGKDVPNIHKVCVACGTPFMAWRNTQVLCKNCYEDSLKTDFIENGYDTAGGGGYCFQHRKIAEKILGRKLNSNEVVHHLNLHQTDNSLTNLIVLSRQKHGALHSFLRTQKVIFEKSAHKSLDDDWSKMACEITEAWLTSAHVKVEKLWEIANTFTDNVTEVK